MPAPKPKGPLGYYRLLGPKCGLRVSPFCLGAMCLGTAWEAVGVCDKDRSFELLDYYKSQGGNFIDTANIYQDEQSEQTLGEWMASRDCRDQMVIATKYSMSYKKYGKNKDRIQANYGGDNAKSMRVSVNDSLKKLKTEYIDILYVHHWTYDTAIEDLMLHLNHLVVSGKVLFLGASDFPAWIVAKCNQYARDHGLHQFVVYQGLWNASERAFEREILPMCRAEGMAIAPWGAVGSGAFKTEEQWNDPNRRPSSNATDAQKAVSKVLETIGKEKNTTLQSVALAYLMHKAPHVFPVVGGKSIEQMKQNIAAMELSLSKEEIERIDDATPFDRGWPHSWVAPQVTHDEIEGPSDCWPLQFAWVDVVKREGAIPAGVHGKY